MNERMQYIQIYDIRSEMDLRGRGAHDAGQVIGHTSFL